MTKELVELGNNTVMLLNDLAAYVLFLAVYWMGVKAKAEWSTSIRSLVTLILTFAFVRLATIGKVDPKDVMLVVSLVYNFYFLVKQRSAGDGNGNTEPPPTTPTK